MARVIVYIKESDVDNLLCALSLAEKHTISTSYIRDDTHIVQTSLSIDELGHLHQYYNGTFPNT